MRPILFLIRSLLPGGAERQLVVLASELHRSGIPVAVATFYGGGQFADELTRAGIPVHNLDKQGRWSNLAFFWRLWRLLRQQRPAVVHSYLAVANLVMLMFKPLMLLQGTAVVCGVRDSSRAMIADDWPTRFSEILQRVGLRLADAVICNSYAGLEHACRGGKQPRHFHVVENGVDPQRYSYTAPGRSQCRAGWGVPEQVALVGLVGRHDPVKDHGLFLAAAAQLSRQQPEIHFVIVGGEVPGISERLKQFAHQLGLGDRLIWAGHRSDLPAVYSALDVLCLSSHSEGFPNVVAEAMSCGLPCVCTNVGDVRRLLGATGWVVEGREPEVLATALAAAVATVPDWQRELPRRRIIENFSVGALGERTLAVLAPFMRRDPA